MKHVGIEIKFYNLDTFKKQIDVNFIDLDSELVDLNYKVTSSIFCHFWRSIPLANIWDHASWVTARCLEHQSDSLPVFTSVTFILSLSETRITRLSEVSFHLFKIASWLVSLTLIVLGIDLWLCPTLSFVKSDRTRLAPIAPGANGLRRRRFVCWSIWCVVRALSI